MPTYDYQCKKCSHKFEAFQSITKEPLKECPQCSGPLKRLIGMGGGIIFKGSGFYATDYRSKEYRDRQKQESKSDTAACPSSKNSESCKSYPTTKDAR